MTKQLLSACNSTSCQVASATYTVCLQVAIARHVTANALEHFQMSGGTGNQTGKWAFGFVYVCYWNPLRVYVLFV